MYFFQLFLVNVRLEFSLLNEGINKNKNLHFQPPCAEEPLPETELQPEIINTYLNDTRARQIDFVL